MERDAKIYVAGHRGMVGSAICRELASQGYENVVTKNRIELDLTRQLETEAFFEAERPEYVFLAAAKVGGIGANSALPANFMYENMMIEMNAITSAWKNGCKKLLFLGSSCIYPRLALQPIAEESLLTGELEGTNEAYALAKISGLKYCEYLRRQHDADFISAMPTNLYGPNDNYDPEGSHVLPAMIRRFHEAKVRGDKIVTCWGDGSPFREFLYVDDLAEACVFLMDCYSGSGTVNVGSGRELSIKELAETIRRVVGYQGQIAWDCTKPNGTPRKLLDTSKIKKMGWNSKTKLVDGISRTYEKLMKNSILN
jgi:GDP-L-fucose synthase